MFRRWLIEYLGGYADVDAVMRYIDETNDWQGKQKVLQPFVKHLFNTIGPEDILQKQGEGWTYRGLPIDAAEVIQLKEEAKLIHKSRIWKMLQDELRYLGNVRMYERSVTDMDIVSGKLLLYLADALKTRLREMTK